MKHMINLVNRVSRISATNEKLGTLTNEFDYMHEDDCIIQTIIKTYSPHENFGISKKEFLKQVEINDNVETSLCDLLDRLDEGTLLDFPYNSGEVDLIAQILDRKLKWKLGTKQLNKAFKASFGEELIYQPKYMRCSVLNDKSVKDIKYPAISQIKEDSEFVNIFFDNLGVRFESRNGKPMNISPDIIEDELTLFTNSVINGELMVHGAKSREENRARISSYLLRSSTRETFAKKIAEAKTKTKVVNLRATLDELEDIWSETERNLYVSVWDIIPLQDYEKGKCEIPYINRLKILSELVQSSNGALKLVESVEVNSFEEAMAHYQKAINRGLEGTIIKNKDMIWKDGTSKDQLKVKEFAEFELFVVGIEEGKGDFEGGLGALICESYCGSLKAKVGSGFTIEERGLMRVDENDSSKGLMSSGLDLEEEYLGRVITVKANAVSTSKSNDHYSLTFPTFIKVRHDKDEADSLDYIKELFKR